MRVVHSIAFEELNPLKRFCEQRKHVFRILQDSSVILNCQKVLNKWFIATDSGAGNDDVSISGLYINECMSMDWNGIDPLNTTSLVTTTKEVLKQTLQNTNHVTLIEMQSQKTKNRSLKRKHILFNCHNNLILSSHLSMVVINYYT